MRLGDSLGIHNGMMFTAQDKDYDEQPAANCAVQYTGAWWYKRCFDANLNGVYTYPPFGTAETGVITWFTFRGHGYSMKYADMKVRPTEPQ